MKLALARTAFAGIVSALVATAASAQTFIGVQTTGAYTANYSFTIDGTLGAITSDNITAWTVGLSDGQTNKSFSNNDGELEYFGNEMSSNGDQLLWNYGSSGYALFWNSDYTSFLCFQSAGCVDSKGGADIVQWAGMQQRGLVREAGNQAIANRVVASVPEPGTWAMMIIGFGGIGYSMRRRRKGVASLQTA
jgi:hypothetical protein